MTEVISMLRGLDVSRISELHRDVQRWIADSPEFAMQLKQYQEKVGAFIQPKSSKDPKVANGDPAKKDRVRKNSIVDLLAEEPLETLDQDVEDSKSWYSGLLSSWLSKGVAVSVLVVVLAVLWMYRDGILDSFKKVKDTVAGYIGSSSSRDKLAESAKLAARLDISLEGLSFLKRALDLFDEATFREYLKEEEYVRNVRAYERNTRASDTTIRLLPAK